MPDTTLQSIARVVQGIAPTIATVLGGPAAGALTNVGLSTLAKWLGIPSDNPDPAAVLQAATTAVADPQTRLALMQAENDFILKKQAQDIAELRELKDTDIQLAEMQEKTIPWVDALHKMGRQIMNYSVIIYCVVCAIYNHTISQEELLLIGGPNIAYQLIKGKGK